MNETIIDKYPLQRVEIPVGEETVVGHLRVPGGAGPHAALIFLGPLGSLKEQVSGRYADAMARRGFVTLAIDNRHFGESSGVPRQYEVPARKVEDIRRSLDWLLTRDDVDASRVGAVGISAGVGYMSGAVAEDERIRFFGGVAGLYHDAEEQRRRMGARYEEVLALARGARRRYEAVDEVEEIPVVGEGVRLESEVLDDRGAPEEDLFNDAHRFAVMSHEHILPWDAQGFAAKIDVPTLMVHSEAALAPALARSFYDKLAGPKQEVWWAAKGQGEFHDVPEVIEPVADRLAAYFSAQLDASLSLYVAAPASVPTIPCSPSSWAAYIALLEAPGKHAISWLRYDIGEHRSELMLGLNPEGTLPVLVDHGEVLTETFELVERIVRRPGHPLSHDLGLPHDERRALAEAIDRASASAFEALMKSGEEDVWGALCEAVDGWARHTERVQATPATLDSSALIVFVHVATASALGFSTKPWPSVEAFIEATKRRPSVSDSWPMTMPR